MVVGLVDDEATFAEDVESNKGKAAGNKNWDCVEFNALTECFFDFDFVRVHPVANVLAFDPEVSGVGGPQHEIEALIIRK